MSAAAQKPQALTDIEYKLLLIAYIHTQPDDALNKGRVISTLFASAGPVGNNPASMPQLLAELKVDNVGQVAAAGADTFVAGSAIFGGASTSDYRATIAAMRAALESVAER